MNQKRNNFSEFMHYVMMNILGMLGMSFYILADTFFIARGIGSNGLTALNLAVPVFSLVTGCGLMLGMGGAAKFSVYKAQGKSDVCTSLFSNTLYIAAAIALTFVTVGALFSGQIVRLLGADDEVFAMTNTYLRFMLLLSPIFILNNTVTCFVRNDGSPSLSMLGMLIGSLTNVVFDYIFIFPMQMGILGAILATGFSPVVSLCFLSTHFIRKKSTFGFKLCKLDLQHIKTDLTLGVPSLISELSTGIVIIVFNMLILKINGNIGIAAYGVVTNLALVVNSIFSGVAQGMQPLTSRSIGEGNRKKADYFLRCAVMTSLVCAAVIYVLTFLFANEITAVFNSENNPIMAQIAVNGLRLYFIGAFFASVNIVLAVYFASTEKPVPAQIISICRGFAVIIPTAVIMARVFGINGVWLSYPTAEFIVMSVGFAMSKKA